MIKTKWKMSYLVFAMVLFVVILIPLFQNVATAPMVLFFSSTPRLFTGAYMPIVFMSMLEWALIVLYLQSLLSESKKQDVTKFDLSK